MLRVFISALIGLVFLGCGAEKSPSIQSTMFQSVSEEKAQLLQSGKDKRYCIKCGMDLVKYYKTSHASQDEHKHYQYCSIHCLEDHLGEGITLKNPKVVDVSSLKFIPVSEAYYVVGSKKRATMSRISKYAFATKEDATVFQSQYGGDIMDFNGAREKAKEDFKHYKNK
jgi:hypothetical protein